MTFRQIIARAIRDFIINSLTGSVVSDIASSGLNAEDEALVNQFLDANPPSS